MKFMLGGGGKGGSELSSGGLDWGQYRYVTLATINLLGGNVGCWGEGVSRTWLAMLAAWGKGLTRTGLAALAAWGKGLTRTGLAASAMREAVTAPLPGSPT